MCGGATLLAFNKFNEHKENNHRATHRDRFSFSISISLFVNIPLNKLKLALK